MNKFDLKLSPFNFDALLYGRVNQARQGCNAFQLNPKFFKFCPEYHKHRPEVKYILLATPCMRLRMIVPMEDVVHDICLPKSCEDRISNVIRIPLKDVHYEHTNDCRFWFVDQENFIIKPCKTVIFERYVVNKPWKELKETLLATKGDISLEKCQDFAEIFSLIQEVFNKLIDLRFRVTNMKRMYRNSRKVLISYNYLLSITRWLKFELYKWSERISLEDKGDEVKTKKFMKENEFYLLATPWEDAYMRLKTVHASFDKYLTELWELLDEQVEEKAAQVDDSVSFLTDTICCRASNKDSSDESDIDEEDLALFVDQSININDTISANQQQAFNMTDSELRDFNEENPRNTVLGSSKIIKKAKSGEESPLI